MRKFFMSLMLFSILLFCWGTTTTPVLANEPGEIRLMVNGTLLENLTSPPVIVDDFTFVPARDVFEALGGLVDWNETMQLVYIAYGGNLIILQINNSVAHLNYTPIIMDIAPQIINERTMIPVRFPAESLGFLVDWDPDTRTVFVDTPSIDLPTEPPTIPNQNDPPAHNVPPQSPGNNAPQPPSSETGVIVPARDISPAPLVDMSFPQTSVTNINMVNDFRNAIDISTSSEISAISTALLGDNRLIINFYDAEMATTATEFTPVTVNAYSQIRISQFQVTPSNIARVVIHLQSGVHYSISMSPDRRTLSIDFERNHITNISTHSSGAADYITITGNRLPAANVSRISEPNRLVVDMPFASINPQSLAMNSRFVSFIQASQFDPDTARITLDLNDRISFSVDSSHNSITIRIAEATYRNIAYNNNTGVLRLARDHFNPISMHSIVRNDLYRERQIVFTLPGNFAGVYGFGEYKINDHSMLSFDIETINGITTITANTRRVLTTVITEDANYVYISFRHPRDVYDRIVVIDPGHGGSDPGTTSIDGVHEKYPVLDVSLRLLSLFEGSGIRVYMTRIDDSTVSRPARAVLANEVGADLFISVHMNSVAPNQGPRGTETLYHNDTERRGGRFNSAQMAEIFQRHVQRAMGSLDRGLVQGDWDVLVLTEMPAILTEIGFLSNPYESARLKNPAVQQAVAEALFAATLESFSVYTGRR